MSSGTETLWHQQARNKEITTLWVARSLHNRSDWLGYGLNFFPPLLRWAFGYAHSLSPSRDAYHVMVQSKPTVHWIGNSLTDVHTTHTWYNRFDAVEKNTSMCSNHLKPPTGHFTNPMPRCIYSERIEPTRRRIIQSLHSDTFPTHHHWTVHGGSMSFGTLQSPACWWVRQIAILSKTIMGYRAVSLATRQYLPLQETLLLCSSYCKVAQSDRHYVS